MLTERGSNVDTRTEKLIGEGLNRLMAGKTSFVIAQGKGPAGEVDTSGFVNTGRSVLWHVRT